MSNQYFYVMRSVLYKKQFGLSELADVVGDVLKFMNNYKVWAFYAEMGSGKTTFVHELCKQLGVVDAVSSPTFALINEYAYKLNGLDTVIYHMDWYRVNSVDEAMNAGIEDCLLQVEKGYGFCFIEWPEKLPDLVPNTALKIVIEKTGIAEREITLLANAII